MVQFVDRGTAACHEMEMDKRWVISGESVTKYMICLDLPLKVVFLFHLPARRKNIKVFFYVQCSHLRHRTHLKIVEFIAIECDHMFDSGK